MYYNTSNAYKTYAENNVTTADPGKLLMMLYDGAIKFTRFAEIAMNDKDYNLKNKYLGKTQSIIEELKLTLNMDTGEVAQNLDELYGFMLSELVQANIKNDIGKITNVREMLEDLRETWNQIV